MKKKRAKKGFNAEKIMVLFENQRMPIDESSAEKVSNLFNEKFYKKEEVAAIMEMLKNEVLKSKDQKSILSVFVEYCDKIDMLDVSDQVLSQKKPMLHVIEDSLNVDKENVRKENGSEKKRFASRDSENEKHKKILQSDSFSLLEQRNVEINFYDAQILSNLFLTTKMSFTSERMRVRFVDMIVKSFGLENGGQLSSSDVSSIDEACREARRYGYEIRDFTNLFFDRKAETLFDTLKSIKLKYIEGIYSKRGMSISETSANILLGMDKSSAAELNAIIANEKKNRGAGVVSVDEIVKRYGKAQEVIQYCAKKGFDVSLSNAMNMAKMREKVIDRLLGTIRKEDASVIGDPVLLNSALTWRLKYNEVYSLFNFKPLNEKVNEVDFELEHLSVSDLDKLKLVFEKTSNLDEDERSDEILRAVDLMYLERRFLDFNFALEPEYEEKLNSLTLEDLDKLKDVFLNQIDDEVDEDTLIETMESTIDELVDQSEKKPRTF